MNILHRLANHFDRSVKLSMDEAELKQLREKQTRTEQDLLRIKELEQNNIVKIK